VAGGELAVVGYECIAGMKEQVPGLGELLVGFPLVFKANDVAFESKV
jgi:hypothetical protein